MSIKKIYKELEKRIAEAENSSELDGIIFNQEYDEVLDDPLVIKIKKKALYLLNDKEDIDEVIALKDIIASAEHYLEIDMSTFDDEDEDEIGGGLDDYYYDDDDDW